MTPFSETELFNACRTLFGPDLALSSDFLFYLQPGGVKSAYRKLAKETHPDRVDRSDCRLQKRQTDRFRDVTSAYDLLCNFLKQRNTSQPLRKRSARGWSAPQPPPSPPETKPKKQSTSSPPRDQGPKASSTEPGRYFQGNIPFRKIEIGSYLYYLQHISYRDLIESLVWQRTLRPKLGDIACRWGWLAPGDIQSIHNKRGTYRRFGDKAVELGLLNNRQVQTLLWFQRNQQTKLGQFFIERGLLTREQINQAVEELRMHNLRIQMASQKHQHYS